MPSFGSTIRALMAQRGHTVRSMAEAAGLNKDTLNDAMKRDLPPAREETLAKIEAALGVSRGELFRHATVGYDGSTASDLRARIAEGIMRLDVDALATVYTVVRQQAGLSDETGGTESDRQDHESANRVVDGVLGQGEQPKPDEKPGESGEAHA